MKKEEHDHTGSRLKDIILGGQDGLVNVLGVILGVAVATYDTKIVIIAGLAAAFAESSRSAGSCISLLFQQLWLFRLLTSAL